jgi:hypothetical protein
MQEQQTALVDSLIQEYGINVDATRAVSPGNIHVDKNTRIFEVESIKAYLIDTPIARRIACHPHVVGQELEKLAYAAAEKSLPAILELSQIDNRQGGHIVFEQILRAAPGYQLHQAARKLIPGNFRTVYTRPRYTHTSYRDHDGIVQRQINVVYENFSELPNGKDLFIIMQDTVASGQSAKISFEEAVRHCEERGSRIKKWIIYGFIALEGLKILQRLAESHGVPLVAFAMGNLTALCANKYDMPLYGVDEWLWRRDHQVHKLGALVDRSTLSEYVREVVPGADQPGDWSARQTKLFTGTGYEDGDIPGHLENSVRLIRGLLDIGTFTEWQNQLAFKELGMLEAELAGLRPQTKKVDQSAGP